MIELFVGFLISITSLLIGFSLGRHEKPLPPKLQEQLTEIFKKKIPILPGSDVGAVQRPTQDQIDRYRNPKLAQEEQVMQEEFDRLNKQSKSYESNSRS